MFKSKFFFSIKDLLSALAIVSIISLAGCTGTEKTPVGEDKENITIDSAYINFRSLWDGTYEYRAYCNFLKDGKPISGSDIAGLMITASNEENIEIKDFSFDSSSNKYFCGLNIDKGEVELSSDHSNYTGYIFTFDEKLSLPKGTYKFRAMLADGRVVDRDYYFVGEERMPCHDVEDITWSWSGEDLKLYWINPSAFYQGKLRLNFFNRDMKKIMEIEAPYDTESLIIPSSITAKLKSAGDGKSFKLIMETRHFLNGFNYASGYSESENIEFGISRQKSNLQTELDDSLSLVTIYPH